MPRLPSELAAELGWDPGVLPPSAPFPDIR